MNRITGTVLFYLFIFASGVWLTRSGRPYNVIVTTIHKLISVVALVFLVGVMVRANRVSALGAIELVAGMVTGLFFVGTIATGALLTAEKPMPTIVLWLHRITPFLTVLCTAAALYLLDRR